MPAKRKVTTEKLITEEKLYRCTCCGKEHDKMLKFDEIKLCEQIVGVYSNVYEKQSIELLETPKAIQTTT